MTWNEWLEIYLKTESIKEKVDNVFDKIDDACVKVFPGDILEKSTINRWAWLSLQAVVFYFQFDYFLQCQQQKYEYIKLENKISISICIIFEGFVWIKII